MKFAVITPNYNGMPRLGQCVGSVRRQAEDAGPWSLHHHVQDGGSSDRSVEWLQCRSEDPEILNYSFGYASEQDSGMYDAINRGWRNTDAEIYSWLNHDEQYLPGTLGKVARAFIDHPEVDVVWGDYICVNTNGDAIAARREIRADYNYMRYNTCYVGSCTAFFHRRLLEQGDLELNIDYKLSADRELFLRLLEKGASYHHLKSYLSLFLVGEENLSAKHHREMMLEDELIDREHHVKGGVAEQLLSKVGRYGSKVLRGSYIAKRLKYEYVLDETMRSRTFETHDKVGYKYTFK